MLRKLLERIRIETGAPALGALVGDSNGIRARAVVGVRVAGKPEPVRANDPFHIGSCAKAMTATLAARLVEQGKVRWDYTVAEAFPGLKGRIRSEYHSVSLRQLLLHRGGLPEDRKPNLMLAFRLLLLRGDLRAQRLKATEMVLKRAPASQPGTQFAYSNFGYMVAGAMLEQATGQSWESLMRTYLFEPLGMRTAGFGAPRHFAGHTGNPPKPTFRDNLAVLGPAGTVHCSLSDWAAFAQLHLRGARKLPTKLLHPESFAVMHADPYQQEYAMGWVISTKKPRRLGHMGSNTFWYAAIVIQPDADRFYLAAVNWGAQ